MQKRRNSSTLPMELRLFCFKSSIHTWNKVPFWNPRPSNIITWSDTRAWILDEVYTEPCFIAVTYIVYCHVLDRNNYNPWMGKGYYKVLFWHINYLHPWRSASEYTTPKLGHQCDRRPSLATQLTTKSCMFFFSFFSNMLGHFQYIFAEETTYVDSLKPFKRQSKSGEM